MGLEPNFREAGSVAPVSTPPQLSSQQKAAIIVRLLLSQEVSPGLDRLKPQQQTELARAMASLGPISRATLASVVEEFTTALDGLALTAPSGLGDALALLEPYISPIARDGLKAEAEARDQSDPWGRLASLPPERLAPLLETESAEVCAILLSKLGVAKAAQLLADLPDDRAQLIAHSVALTATVTPEMVAQIGLNLLGLVSAVPDNAFTNKPEERVGAMLNVFKTEQRDTMLEGLEARDADFAREVRKSIFTFQHIPKRVEPTDVPRILRRVEPDQVTIAMAAGFAAAPMSVEFLLENMSKRLADQLRDDAEGMQTPTEEAGEAAMGDVVAAIRELEEEGEIRLIPPED